MQLEPTETSENDARDATGPEVFRSILAGCLERRGLKCGAASDGTLVVTFAVGDDATPYQVLLNAGAWAGPGVGALVRCARPVERSKWPAVLAACNEWNGRARLLKARLDADDWDRAEVAQIALDAWAPVGPTPDPTAVDAFVEGTLRAAARFWSSAPSA